MYVMCHLITLSAAYEKCQTNSCKWTLAIAPGPGYNSDFNFLIKFAKLRESVPAIQYNCYIH